MAAGTVGTHHELTGAVFELGKAARKHVVAFALIGVGRLTDGGGLHQVEAAKLLALSLMWRKTSGEDGSWYGRSAALLGLDLPVSTTGLIGIAAALVILAALAAAILLKRPATPSAGQSPRADLLPQTDRDTRLFILFSLVAGFGWELLYRGFLLWALTPLLGAPAAVVVAATAYGLAHGSRGIGSLIGAIISSFLFTIAYALTGSLWWLILLHVGLPLVGLLARAAQRSSANVNTP